MNEKPLTVTVRVADLELVRKALFDAMDDMREYQQVARYNLTGEFLNQQMRRPEPPLLIHQNGIDVTDVRLSNCRTAATLLNQWTDTLPAKAIRVSEAFPAPASITGVPTMLDAREYAPCAKCGHPTVWWPFGLDARAKCENCQSDATRKV